MSHRESQSESVLRSARDSTLGTIGDPGVVGVDFGHSMVLAVVRHERSLWDGEFGQRVILARIFAVPHWQPSWPLLDAVQRVLPSTGPPKRDIRNVRHVLQRCDVFHAR